MLGLSNGVWMMGAGIVLLAVSLLIVNRYDLSRRGPMTVLAGGGKRLPPIASGWYPSPPIVHQNVAAA